MPQIGRGEFVDMAIEATRRLSCRTLTVAVDAANEPARRTYQRAGFATVMRRFTYFVPAPTARR